MARGVDTRIVQMQFDNKNFEKNIEVSGKSLDKFKEKLDFTKYEKSLEDLERNVSRFSFDKMADNLQKLTDKFTGLGTMSELVLSQIRRGIEKTAAKISGFVDQLGMSQVTAGMDKYGKMNKNVQTIMAATGKSEEEVYEVLKRLNEYTDQTSYNFTDMASNIGKFTSVGIPLERAERQMEGIANWAARSGAGINEASRAMYNLSQAMGVGALTKIDWKSIENANMATKEFKQELIDAGLAMGTLVMDAKGTIKTAKQFGKQMEVTYQNISETLSKKWANTSVMQEALEAYYYEDLYYEHQGDTPLVEMTKEQMKKVQEIYQDSKIDKKDWQWIEEQGLASEEMKEKAVEAAVAMGNLVKVGERDGKMVYKTAEKYGKQIEFTMDSIEKSFEVGWMNKSVGRQVGLLENLAEASYEAAQKCMTLTDVFEAWKDQLSTGWMKAWQTVFGELSEAMETFSAICNKVGDTFTHFIQTLTGGTNDDGVELPGILGAWAAMGGRDTLWSMIIGEYDGLYEGAYGLLDVIKDIGGIIKNAFWDLAYTFYSALTDNPASKEEWDANEVFRQEFIGGQIERAIENVRNFIEGIQEFFNEIPVGSTKSRIQMIGDVVSGVGHVITLVYTAVRDTFNFFKGVVKQLEPSFDAILGLLSALGIGVKDMTKTALKGGGLKTVFDGILEIIRPLTGAINTLIEGIAGVIKVFIGSEEGGAVFAGIWERITSALQSVARTITRIGTPVIGFIGDFLKSVKQLLKTGINKESLKTFAKQIKTAFKNLINNIFSFIPDFTGKVKGFFTKIKNVFSTGFSAESIEALKADVKKIWEFVKSKIPEGFKTAVKTAIQKVKDFFQPFVDDVKNVFNSGFSAESLQQLKERFKTIAQGIIDKIPTGVKEAVTSALDKVKEFFNPFVQDVLNVFRSGFSPESIEALKERFKTIGRGIVNALPEGIRTAIYDAYARIKNIFKPISDLITDISENGFDFEKIKEAAKKMWENIKDAFFPKNEEGNRNMDFAGVILAVLGGGVIFGIIKLVKSLTTVTSLIGGVKTGKFISKIGIIGGAIAGLLTLLGATDKDADKYLENGEGNIFQRVFSWIRVGFDKLKQLGSDVLSGSFNIADKIKEFLGIKKNENPEDPETKSFVEKAIDWISEKWQSLKTNLQKLVGNFGGDEASFGTQVMNFLKKVDLSKILLAVIGVLGIRGIIKTVKGIVKSVKILLHGASVITDAIDKGFKSLAEPKKVESFGDKMLKLAGAIAILSACVVVIGNMDAGMVWNAIGAIAVLMAALVGFSFALKYAFKDMNPKQAATMVLSTIGLAVAVMLLARAIKPLTEIGDWDTMWRAVVALALVMAEMLGFLYLIKRLDFTMEMMVGVLALCAGIWLLVNALMEFANISDENFWKSIGKMLVGLGGILLLMFGFVWAVGKWASGSLNDKGLIEMAAVALAVAILVYAVMPLANMRWDQLAKIGAGLFIIMVIVGAFVVIVSKTMGSNGLKDSGLIQLAAVAFAIGILVLACLPLAFLNDQQLGQMMGGLLAVVVIIGLLAAAAGLMNKKGLGLKDSGLVSLLAVAGAIFILVLAMLPLALMKPEQLVKGILGILFLVAILVLFMRAVDGIKMKGSGLVQLIALVGAIVLLVICMIPLSMMPLGDLAKAVGAIILLVGSMALLMLAASKVNSKKGLASLLVMMGGLAAVIFVLEKAIKASKDVDPTTMIALMGGIAAIILVLAAAIAVLSLIKNPASMFIAVAALTAGVAAIMGAISLMLPVLADSLGSSLENIMSKLALVSTMFRNFGTNMDGVSENSLEGAKRKFEILIEICKVMWGVDKYYGAISAFEQMMLKLGTAVSQFQFSTEDITDPASSNGVKLIQAILGMKDQFAGFTIGNIASEILGLGTALSLFNFATAGIGESSPGLKMLQDLAGEAGNLDTLSKVNLFGLKSNLAGLGGALAIYAEGAMAASSADGEVNVDETAMQKAVELMQKVSQSFTKENGFEIPDLPEEGVITGFGADLAALAIALKKFAFASLGLVGTEKALSILDFMADLKSRLTFETLATAEIFRRAGIPQSQLESFGLEIAALGVALSHYSQSVQDFKRSKEAEDALTFFQTLKNKLTASAIRETVRSFDELGSDGVQVKSVLTEFGTNIGELGEALAGFAKNVNFDDKTKEKFDAAIKSLESINTIANTLPVVGGIAGFIHGNVETLGTMADDIEKIGGSLKLFSDTLNQSGNNQKKFDTEIVESGIEALTAFAQLAFYMGEMGIGDIKLASFDSLRTLTDWMSELNTNTSDSYIGAAPSVLESMAQFMKDLEAAIGKAGGVQHLNYFEAFKNMAQGIASLVNVNPKLDFKIVGENITAGIRNGILAGQKDAEEAIKTVVSGLKTTAETKLEEKSPSRLFMRIGQYASQGLALGITKDSDEPEKATKKMVSNLIENGPLSHLSALLAGEIDPNPTITPVLDLSNVQTGLSTMGGMFGGQYGLGVTAGQLTLNTSGLNQLANLANPVDYRPTLDGIRSEVGQLRNDLRTLSNAVGRMKFVMDGSAVVGAIGPEMDEYLGRQGFYAARTVIP